MFLCKNMQLSAAFGVVFRSFLANPGEEAIGSGKSESVEAAGEWAISVYLFWRSIRKTVRNSVENRLSEVFMLAKESQDWYFSYIVICS